MRIPRVFQDLALQSNTEILLDGFASRYLRDVLRLKVTNPLVLFNGDGKEYSATISAISKRDMRVQIIDVHEKNLESALMIHLGQVISKGEHMEFTLQKATELGVTTITPLFSSRSEIHLKGEREEKKLAHWQRIIISACEQCGRNRIPRLLKPLNIYEWIQQSDEETKFILNHHMQEKIDTKNITQKIALLVGPEGGLTIEEKNYAQSNHFVSLQLGPRVLRTETAGIAAIVALQVLTGDLFNH